MFRFFKERFSQITQALAKTKTSLFGKISLLFKAPWDETTFEQLEQILYEADLGSASAIELVDETRIYLKKHPDGGVKEVLSFLHAKCLEALEIPARVTGSSPLSGEPQVILIVGVNGSGKTTTIAKLANLFKREGKQVLIAAADTFRAAASDQLATWAERLNVPLIRSQSGGDPSAVVYDALTAAKARGVDIVLIDTAGRLQNKMELMRELEKVGRVIRKIVPTAPHETLLVLDATTGQNGIDQAEVFHTSTPLTGIVLAKLDGSAKGGIVLGIYKKLGIPVQWVGVGETLNDLVPFDKTAYVDGLFGES